MSKRSILALAAGLLLCALPALAQTEPPRTPAVGGCAITATSATCLAAVFRYDLTLTNSSAYATVACAFNTAAVLNGATSYTLYPGDQVSWHYSRGNPPPAGPLVCIGSDVGTLRIEYY